MFGDGVRRQRGHRGARARGRDQRNVSVDIETHNSFLFKRDVNASIGRVVPRLPQDCGAVFVRRDSARGDVVFPIRVERTIRALRVLHEHNPEAYRGMDIDEQRILAFLSAAQHARQQGQDPDHAFDHQLVVVDSDDVVDASFGREDASRASGSRSGHSSASFMHESDEDDLRAAIAKILPRPRVPAVQHVRRAHRPRRAEPRRRFDRSHGGAYGRRRRVRAVPTRSFGCFTGAAGRRMSCVLGSKRRAKTSTRRSARRSTSSISCECTTAAADVSNATTSSCSTRSTREIGERYAKFPRGSPR